MEKIIVKFKNDLKKIQSTRKKILEECGQEITILSKILNEDLTLCGDVNVLSIDNKLLIANTIGALNKEMMSILMKYKRKSKKEERLVRQTINQIYDSLLNFTEKLKKDYITTQNIINAFENDKIKDPINSIAILFNQMAFTTLTIEEIDRIIGMAIIFNSQYAERNKKHKIEAIDAIHQLANDYYNNDGSYKYEMDMLTFERKITELIKNYSDGIEIAHPLLSFNKGFTADDLIALRFENNKRFRHQQLLETTHIETTKPEENFAISEKVRKALQELKKYYKKGSVIAIPDNLEEFYSLLEESNLDSQEKKYIIDLMNKEISKKRNIIIDKYLSSYEKDIYFSSIELLNKFTYSNADPCVLKQYIEELQTILQFLETETNNSDKEYLLSEIPTIIEQLAIICSRYKVENNQSTNRLIFLTTKNGTPYITEDIDSLDSVYEKAIYSLINKINPDNQSQFRKVLNNEPMAYNMYEVISPRAHVAFVEIDAGIYIIIGANIPRTGYKGLNNRLKSNIKDVERIETIVKNPAIRNQILKENEIYLPAVSDQRKGNKLALKNT